MKKSRILLVVLLLFAALSLSSFPQAEVKNIDSRGKAIICFGDSITYGYGVNKGEDYPTALSKLLNTKIINAGVDGDTTTRALKRLKADVLSKDPLLVIIEFCGNDFVKKVNMDETVNNLKEMIGLVQAGGAIVAVVDISAGMFLKEYRQAFQKIALENKAIFVPAVLSGIITNPGLKSDFLHPNKIGYTIIAHRVYRAIIPVLNRNAIKKRLVTEAITPSDSAS